MKSLNLIFIIGIMLFLFGSCEKPLGDKTDLGFIDVPKYDDNIVAFVPIQPAISNMSNPVDIIIGYDELIYVADKGQQRIQCFDQSGQSLGTFSLSGVKSIAQNRQLDLIVLGTHDTLINNITYKLDAIYHIRLQGNNGYGLKYASVKKKIIHPFYFKTSFTASDTAVHLNAISVMADDTYYVTRSGPSNAAGQIGGPDDAVLVFNKEDQFITTVNVTTEQGLVSDYFRKPFGITTLAKPPQSNNVKQTGDFLFTSLASQTTLKVQYIRYESSDFGSSYTLNTSLAGSDTSKADGFLYTPNRFQKPRGVTIAGDGTNYIFVTDSDKDSLYLFTITGLEGVQPPAGNTSTKNIKVSFGGTGSGLKQFRNPTAVAYHNKIVYVCDSGNGRILRFKLTTDFRD